MDIHQIVNNLQQNILQSQHQMTRRKVKTLLPVDEDKEKIQIFINNLLKILAEKNIESSPELSTELLEEEWVIFRPKKPAKIQHTFFQVPDDFLDYLFEFDSYQEYERFQAALDATQPVGLFLIPLKKDFYSGVIERILSYEIIRKRQYQGDFKVGDIAHLELGRFTDEDSSNANENIWDSYDIFHFNEATMLNVVLGQSATELIESEKFEKKFNQLSLYSNKYYSGQFFIMFHCPSFTQIVNSNRGNVLEKLVENISQKFPHVFKLQCRYRQDSEIDPEVKKSIFNHFRVLLEVPSCEIDLHKSLLEYYSELQKVQQQAENQILLNISPSYFQKLKWRYETDEHVYMQYFTLRTLHQVYNYPLKSIECGVNISRMDTQSVEEYSAIVDVKADHDIIVKVETLSKKANDKNVYLTLMNTLKEESKAWNRKLKEFWLVLPGFEVARNYYQIRKVREVLLNAVKGRVRKDFEVVVFVPDYLANEIRPVDLDNVYQPELKIQIKKSFKSVQEEIKDNRFRLNFSHVKGLKEEKGILQDFIALQKEEHRLGLGGILFFGLPGCGKTYLSQAFANELKRNFFSFSPADIQSVWIGQSQKNIKDIFSQAKSKNPSFLFLDELDSIGFSRNEDQAHADQKATINQLLLELNNVDESDILVVGATNRLSSLDTALKRSGRFDLKIPIFPPDAFERAQIFAYYVNLLNEELIRKKRETIIIDEVYSNFLGEESIGFTSSDIKLIINNLRIDNLLKKKGAADKNNLIKRIQKFINDGQRTLKKENVSEFIAECLRNDHYSLKIDFLRQEWNL